GGVRHQLLHRNCNGHTVTRKPYEGLIDWGFRPSREGDQIEEMIAIDRERNPGTGDDLSRHCGRVGDALRNIDERLWLHRLVFKAALYYALGLERRLPGYRDAVCKGHGNRAVAGDHLIGDSDASRAWRDTGGYPRAEKSST